jgi:hypothetical protein
MVSFVWRQATRKGLLGGDRRWMAVFAVVGMAKLLRRLSGSGRPPEPVYRTELKPGEALMVRHLAAGADATMEG